MRRLLVPILLATLVPTAAWADGEPTPPLPPPPPGDITSLTVAHDPLYRTVVAQVGVVDAAAGPVGVRLGQYDAAGGCTPSGPAQAGLTPGYSTWSADLGGGALYAVQRLEPTTTGLLAAALTDPLLGSRQLTCATAVAGEQTFGPVPVTAGAVPRSAPGSPTVVQLDYQFHDGQQIDGRRAPIDLTCLASATSRCRGSLSVEPQGSHRSIGRTRFSIPLGRQSTVVVRLARYPFRPYNSAKLVVSPQGGPVANGFVTLRRP